MAQIPVATVRDDGLNILHSRFVSAGEWIEYALQITCTPPEQLFSPSRRRHLTLPRAFIAHHGRQLGFTLAELAYRLQRHPATVLEAVERALQLAPDLFSARVTARIIQRDTRRLQQLWQRHADAVRRRRTRPRPIRRDW